MTKFWSQSISVKAAFLVVLILSLGTSPDIFLDQRDDRNLFNNGNGIRDCDLFFDL